MACITVVRIFLIFLFGAFFSRGHSSYANSWRKSLWGRNKLNWMSVHTCYEVCTKMQMLKHNIVHINFFWITQPNKLQNGKATFEYNRKVDCTQYTAWHHHTSIKMIIFIIMRTLKTRQFASSFGLGQAKKINKMKSCEPAGKFQVLIRTLNSF